MKIPKDVSGLRRKFMQAAAIRKQGSTASVKTPPATTPDPRVKKANDEAKNARIQLRERMKSEAEKDARIQELQAALDEATKKVTEFEPDATRWRSSSHKRKEMLIAKFPKEDQARVRKMDVDDVEFLARRLAIGGETPEGGGASQKSGTKITSLKEAEKADAATYNKFMDDIAAGTIKIDAQGMVVA